MTPRKGARPQALATLALHGGRDASSPDSPVVTPLFQSVYYVMDPGAGGDEVKYPRYGNTPNAELVQRRLAAIEGAERSLLLASGQGATACALLALLRPGDHLLASQQVYGGTWRLLAEELPSMGIDVTLVDPMETRVWRRRLRKETRAIYLECPVNPTSRILDLQPIAALTKETGLALVVDATFASPVNLRPLEHGADVVLHSATKYLAGHHDVLGGVVSGTEQYIDEVCEKMRVWGQAPDPFAAWLLERGLKTLHVRVRQQNENAGRIAAWLEGRKEVRKVHYPGLASHPDHEVARRMLDGFGGMLAVELVGGAKAADRLIRRLRVWTHAPSLGGVDSLVSEPRHTSHSHLSSEARAKAGIPDGFLRLSVGIEDADDLIADLEQALK